jgi:hypothetical protein
MPCHRRIVGLGRTDSPIDTLLRITEALEADPAELLREKGENVAPNFSLIPRPSQV